MNNYENQLNLAQSLINRTAERRALNSSKSPVKPKPQTQWATVAHDALNKTEIVESSSRQTKAALNISNMSLPTKLAKMKEKVKRERSQNTINNENRDNSLYGRQKTSAILDEETQKLRESYNLHRKTSQNKDRSISGMRSSVGGLSNGNGFLNKQNFKEDPYDNQYDLEKSHDFQQYRTEQQPKSSRQIALQLKQQNESQQSQINRFKRTTQKSQITLANYQMKYQKLEENYKKFAQSITNQSQTEDIIMDLKFKTGISFMMKFFNRYEAKDLKWALRNWRVNSGLAIKQFNSQGKMLVLTRALQKMMNKSANFHKIACYQRWKRMSFKNQKQTQKERICSILSEMMTDSSEFNRCVENDCYFQQTLTDKIEKIIDVVASDFFFFSKNDKDEEHLKTYHLLSGDQLDYPAQSLYSSSVLGKIVFDNRGGDQIIQVFQMLQKDSFFNKDVDLPVNKEKIIQYNQAENNVFNKVRYLSLVMIKIQHPVKMGVLRLFFSCPQNGCSPTSMQMKMVNDLAQILPLFLQRVFDIRSQINTLAINNMDNREQLNDMDFYYQANQTLKDYQEQLMADNCEVIQSKSNLLSFTSNMIESFISEQFEIDNLVIKQVMCQSKGLIEENTKELIKSSNHHQENLEVIEDFLDHRKEFYVHQISVCPKDKQEFEEFTFIFQKQYNYEGFVDHNASIVNVSTSLTSNIMSFSAIRNTIPKKYLEQDIKRRLCYFLRHLCPILKSSLLVAEQLVPSIAELEQSVKMVTHKYQVQQQLQQFSLDLNLAQEQNQFEFYSKMKDVLRQAFSLMMPGVQDIFELFLNKTAFHLHPSLLKPNLVFHAYFNFEKTESFAKYIVTTLKLDEKKPSKYDISPFQGLNEVGFSIDVFESQITQVPSKSGEVLVYIPIVDASKYLTLAVITFVVPKPIKMEVLLTIGQELQTYLLSFSRQRAAFQELQNTSDMLLARLQGEKVSQETKDLIEQNLIVPFLRKQSLKQLGDSLGFLSDKLITNNGESLDEPGQELAQVAFLGPKAYIDDIRDFNTYSQTNLNFSQIDKMIIQSYQLKQHFVYEDDIMNKIVVLFPLMSMRSYKSAFSQLQNAIILKFLLDRDSQVEQKVNNIRTQFIYVLAPVMDAILQHEIISVKQTYAIEKISNIFDKYKCARYRDIIYFMRDLKAKNVYNFSRSRLYSKLAKSKLFFDRKDLNNQLFDYEDKHLAQQNLIQQSIRKAIVTMNKFAHVYKKSCFKKFVIGTRTPLYANMSKKKKKALSTMFSYSELVIKRLQFVRLAINTKNYKRITHPKTKLIGSIQCLFRNFREVRQRLAFFKLKKNLNVHLRNLMASYQENDKDLFIQLNQILISSQNQQGGLEGGLSYSLSEIFTYLRNNVLQQQSIREVGTVANGNFVGHVDEVILTMKSCVYTPMMSLTSPMNGQHLQIFKCNLMTGAYDINNHQKRKAALRLSYDSNTGLSQENQLLMQINNQNLEQLDQNDIVPLNEFETQLSTQFKKYQISLKKDLIQQMLEKSNGITFNFQNIQQSLSDIYLGQQSNHKDGNIGERYTVIRKSKSALIIPLFDVSQQVIIGSFEIYKYHQQAFTEEIEARYEYLAKMIGDFFLLYGQLKQHTLQISQLKWQMQKAIKPVQSLSHLLKNVYVNGPEIHFPAAAQVLPIILMNQTFTYHQNERPVQWTQKLAFFYQFRDNHIYSFDFEGTFIDEILDNGCIMEMIKRSALQKDEIYNLDAQSKASSIDNIKSIGNDDQTTNRSNQNSYMLISDQEILSNRFGGQRHRTMQTPPELIKSVTNELFRHIIYYPIFDVQDETKIIAVFEVAYKKRMVQNENLLPQEVQEYLDQFRCQLQQFKVRLSSFSRNLENLIVKRHQKQTVKGFQTWKSIMLFMKLKEQYQNNQFAALQNQEMCYGEYLSNLENYNSQIKVMNDEKTMLERQVMQQNVEKKAKLKFLATSLLSSNNLFKNVMRHKLKEAFLKWQYNVSVRKIVETAFNRVLELNHRHSKARLQSGVFLLQQVIEGYAMQSSFNRILQAAHMRRNNIGTDESSVKRRSCSKNRGIDNSQILSNVTSLLTPMHLKKIEKVNLYQQQINSFYNPSREAHDRSHMTSALVNARNQTMNNSDLAIVQLMPHEVTKAEAKSTLQVTQSSVDKRVDLLSKSPSRYAKNLSQLQIHSSTKGPIAPNPFRQLNLSQIDHIHERKDYSPILTTGKHQLQQIYNIQRNHITSFHSARGEDLVLPKKAHSVEKKKVLSSSTKNIDRRLKNQPLEKQLQIKQMQLEVLREQIVKEKQRNRSYSIEHPIQSAQINLRGNRVLHPNFSSNDLDNEFEKMNIQTTHDQFLNNGLTSTKNNQNANYEKESFGENSTIAGSRAGVSEVKMANYNRKKQSVMSQSGRRSKNNSRREHSNKSKSSLNKHSQQQQHVPKKYAEINGRDVSPPVRDRKKQH